MSDPVQPARKRLFLSNKTGFVGKCQERHLESILGVVPVVEDARAHAHHHRTVPLNQSAEGRLARLIAPGHELLEQLDVRQTTERSVLEQRLELLGKVARSPACHALATPLTKTGRFVPAL